MPVNSVSPSLEGPLDDMTLCRTLLGGTKMVRAAGEMLLPREEAETNVEYNARRNRSFFANYYGRAVEVLSGKPFSKPPLIQNNTTDIDDFRENVDGEGEDFHSFARQGFKDLVTDGIFHILTDYPTQEEGATLADAMRDGARPYWVPITGFQMVGFKYDISSGLPRLTEFRYREWREEDSADDDFATQMVECIRVLRPGSWELWKRKGDESEPWIKASEGKTSLDYIPISTAYGKKVSYMVGEPPLIDLAHLNVAHWQSMSDQRHILHVARVPILFYSGADTSDKSQVQVGANRMIRNSEPAAQLKYVEHTGSGINAGRQDLLDLQEMMAVMSMEPLLQQPSGDITATAKAIDTAEANSALQAMALSFQNALETALTHVEDYYGNGRDDGPDVRLSLDFNIVGRVEDIQNLIQLRQMGEISRKTFFDELKRRNLLADDFDEGEDKELLDDEEPMALVGREPPQEDQPGTTPGEETEEPTNPDIMDRRPDAPQ